MSFIVYVVCSLIIYQGLSYRSYLLLFDTNYLVSIAIEGTHNNESWYKLRIYRA